MFSKNTSVTLRTFHLRLVEPPDGASQIWRTNCILQTGTRACTLRRKNTGKPTDAKVQNKNWEDGKGIQALAMASMQS